MNAPRQSPHRLTHALALVSVISLGTIANAPQANAGSSESSYGRDQGDGSHRHHHDDRDHYRREARRAGGMCTTIFQFTGPAIIHIDGHCALLHLGDSTLSAEQTVSQNPDGSVSAVNDSVYTAANGDQLFSHFVGVAVPSASGLVLSGTETYDGGTGRFEDAEGHALLQGTVQFTSPSGGIGQYRVAGLISYS
jgi:hypothetical protein